MTAPTLRERAILAVIEAEDNRVSPATITAEIAQGGLFGNILARKVEAIERAITDATAALRAELAAVVEERDQLCVRIGVVREYLRDGMIEHATLELDGK